jgi:prepilin-type N-terminal cleavage/methylation domain-containing protein
MNIFRTFAKSRPIGLSGRGFTLIELLVVIAIIALLSAVVLASLGTARNKAIDASIKSGLAGARTQAQLYYDNNSQTYSGICTSGTNNIAAIVDSAAKRLSGSNTVTTAAFSYSATGAANSAVCHDTSVGWATVVSIKSPTTASSGWCVDSSGNSKEAATLTLGSVVCGT